MEAAPKHPDAKESKAERSIDKWVKRSRKRDF